ncbi:unnamed protein product [Rhodiola kirilowii]
MGLFASAYKILEASPLKKIAASSPDDPSSQPAPAAAASPRIRLKDGRYLAYIEKGVPKSQSKYRIIIVHGFGRSKETHFPATQELVNELGIYFLMYDRAGYGESDPNPKRSLKSEALDIQELADQLQIGPRFYLIGVSMGSYPIWSCLHYIPHRLAGAAMVVPVVNYTWPSLPESLIKDDYRRKILRWGIRVAKHAPGLVHWWLSNIWFRPSGSKIDNNPLYFSTQDLEILNNKKSQGFPMLKKSQIRKRTVFEALRSDVLAGFGRWEFDPVDIIDPIHVKVDHHEEDHTSPSNKGSNVHVWQGFEDKVVPYPLMRHVCEKVPWLNYHEVKDGGHLLVHEAKNCNAILRSLLFDEEHCSYYASTQQLNSSNQ